MRDENKHKIAKGIYNSFLFLKTNRRIILTVIGSSLITGLLCMYLPAIIGWVPSLREEYFYIGAAIGFIIPLIRPSYNWVMKWKEPIN